MDELEQAMGAYVDAALPRLQAALEQQLAAGRDVGDFIGLIVDGTGKFARFGEVAVVVPRVHDRR